MTEWIARFLVRAASRLAPAPRRAMFVREWLAELEWEQSEGAIQNIRHAGGAFADAWTIHRLATGGGGLRPSVRAGSGWSVWWYDFRAAGRSLRRSPGFTAVTTLTLALGLGGAGVIYSLLDSVVLNPLPYPDADRLVFVDNQVPGVGPDEVWGTSTAQQEYYAEHSATLEQVGTYRALGANLQTPSGPERAYGWRVTADVLSMLGARVQHGRLIQEADDLPGAPDVVLISNGLWERQFSHDPDVVGRALLINARPAEIIGVLAPGVAVPVAPAGYPSDLWVPLRIDPDGNFSNNHVFQMVGRLAPGATLETADAEFERLESELPARFPQAYRQEFFDGSGFHTRVRPLKDAVVGDMSRNLWILFGAVLLVLAIAGANVANLFATRVEGRNHDLAVRTALGASRWDLARSLLAESLWLAGAGAILALALGVLAGPYLLSLAPDTIPRLESVRFGVRTLAFGAVLTMAVGGGLGMHAILRHRPSDLRITGDRRMSAGRPRQRLRGMLVVTQVALALTLLVGAGLLMRSLQRLNAIDPGFEGDQVMTARLYLTPVNYRSDVAGWRAYSEILERLRALPTVTAAGMSTELPVSGSFGCTVQGFEAQSVYDHLRETGQGTCAGQDKTTPGYFAAMGIPILAGRDLSDADHQDPTRGAVVVSQKFAETFWPGQNPIGKGVAPNGRREPPYYHVVGVVGDVPARSLEGDPANAVYYPIVHDPNTPGNWGYWDVSAQYLVIRTNREDPTTIIGDVRRAVAAVDPTIPVAQPRPMREVVAMSTERRAFVSTLLGVAAAIAMTIAAVGLYGVVSYVVSRSTREIGVRVAIGARPPAVLRMFLQRSMGLVTLGLGAGVVLALATTRFLQGLLYGVEPTDPMVFAVGAGVLLITALVATWLPARRATQVDPVEALREV